MQENFWVLKMAEFRNVGKFYRSLDKWESHARGIGGEAEETF